MVTQFYKIKEILTHPTDRPDQVIIARSTSLPDFLQTSVAVLVTLLSIPAIIVVSWGVEHAFFTTTTFGREAFGELALPLGACILAATVFWCRNPMHSLLALLGVFFSTVLMYLIAGIVFVGLVFLIVYVGAVAVLFLFVIMLLNVKSLTSQDRLLRHVSQVGAIGGGSLLLRQTHGHVIDCMDRSMAADFLRDAVIEPSTGEAIFFYIRFRAMDINALTGLYTVHTILFLVTTAILLAALLGAIILATVTTERATSVADIRQYSVAPVSKNMLLTATIFLVISPDWNALSIFFNIDLDFTSILMSAPLFRIPSAIEDRFLENNRQWQYRCRNRWPITDTRYSLLDSHVNTLRLTAKCKLPRRVLRLYNKRAKHLPTYARKKRFLRYGGKLYQDRLPIYKKKIYAILSAPLSTLKTRRALHRRRVFRLHASSVLAPVMFKLLRARSVGAIIRRRWLWRWRRDRATSLFRLDRNYEYSRPRYNRRYYRPDHPYAYFSRDEKRVFQSHWYERLLFAHPRTSFRWSPIKYLRYMWSLHIVTRIWCYAWRIRAFCVILLFYLALVPVFTLIVYFFYEDYDVVFAGISKVHQATWRLWYGLESYERLPPLTWAECFAACLLIFPSVYVAWTLKYVMSVTGVAAIFAYDTVRMHGGELSDVEFHESRCNYWRKLGWARKQQEIDAAIARALVRSRLHPDKGYTDAAEAVPTSIPFWVVVDDAVRQLPTWASDPIYRVVNLILPWYLYIEIHILLPVYWYAEDALTFLKSTQVYRCLSAVPGAAFSAFVSKYPFVLDWYAAVLGFYATTTQSFGDLVYSAWCFWCQEIWPHITPVLERISCRHTIVFNIFSPNHAGMTFLLYVLISAGFLYSFSSLFVLLHWKRLCCNTLVRRPPVLLPLSTFFASLWALAAFFPAMGSLESVLGLPYEYNLQYTYYERYQDMGGILRYYARYPAFFLWLWFMCWYFQWTTTNDYDDRPALDDHRPVMVRAYFNAWAEWSTESFLSDKDEFENELESFSSITDAYEETAIEADEEDYDEYREEQAKLLHFNIVMHTYIPTYYDVHPVPEFRNYRHTDAYFSDKHHDNAFHSA